MTETGIFTPRFQPVGELRAGDVGYIAASIKTVADTRVGDTITDAANPAAEALGRQIKELLPSAEVLLHREERISTL